MIRTRLKIILTVVFLVISTIAASPATRHHAGTLPDGATWIADVPGNWNGAVVLYSHGFTPGPDNPARNAPDATTASALLARGYALAGSSYAQAGWALGTAVTDQLDTLSALTAEIGPPREVIAFGQSMGGLVSALLAERAGNRIAGALSTCGLVGGALNLNNFQLDGTYAMAVLLLPGQQIQLTGFTTIGQANATTTALVDALRQAQQTPAGQARIALAAALMNSPTWYSGDPSTDPVAQEQAQFQWLLATLPFVIPARVSINTAAGGDGSWNAGVNYRQLVFRSAHLRQISSLYRQAGLPLGTDLDVLARGSTYRPDLGALGWLARTSAPTGRITMPELDMHTVADNLAPVEFESEYAGVVRRAGRAGLLRQAYVARPGHCSFTPAEYVAALLALDGRIHHRNWVTDPGHLQAAATALGLGPAAFTQFQPSPFVNTRRWAN